MSIRVHVAFVGEIAYDMNVILLFDAYPLSASLVEDPPLAP